MPQFKNIMAANFQKGYGVESSLRKLLNAQIANSLAVGWKPQDIVVVSNLDFDIGITHVKAPLTATCLTGSKMFAVEHLFDAGSIGVSDICWVHDLDAWQNYWFDPPPFQDVGIAEYNVKKFNGGSLFLRSTARDLIFEVTSKIRSDNAIREEPAINAVFRSDSHRRRVTVIDSTFNVGCSAYSVRHGRSSKPILVSHFHPDAMSAWRTHTKGDRNLQEGSISPRLFSLLVDQIHGGRVPVDPRF